MKSLLLILAVTLAACSSKSVKNENIIAGIMPVDIYKNLEDKNFTLNKNFHGADGNSWVCTSKNEGEELSATVFSHNINTVESISATIICTPPKMASSHVDFLQYVSTAAYDSSQPKEASLWVGKNINKDKATTNIGGVSFTINSPTKWARTLTIEKANK